MILLDTFAKIETPNGLLTDVRAVVDSDTSRLYAFAVGPRLVLSEQVIIEGDSSIPLRGNGWLFENGLGDSWRVIATRGGCGCGGRGVLRGTPVSALLALVAA